VSVLRGEVHDAVAEANARAATSDGANDDTEVEETLGRVAGATGERQEQQRRT
jgi:hypothetical protein